MRNIQPVKDGLVKTAPALPLSMQQNFFLQIISVWPSMLVNSLLIFVVRLIKKKVGM
jgi:hypothetical protein